MGEDTNVSVDEDEGLLLEVSRMLTQEKNKVEVIVLHQFYSSMY
jgi:1-phosphatidylinositol-3-phosphate 5-kinase